MKRERIHSFYAFHGTAESCSINILGEKKFEIGTPREDHWLGQGIYFFREDLQQAFMWAKNKVKKHHKYRNQKPTVIETRVSIEESKFLNLDTRDGMEELNEFIEYLKSEKTFVEAEWSDDLPAKIRCFVLSLLPEDIWMIQRTFNVERSKYTDSTVLKSMDIGLQGVQLCVRNHDAILTDSMSLIPMDTTGIHRKKRKSPRAFGA
ncbi:hypothetical protein ACQVQT_16130 [Bacillus paranthracis]|uniref:hypothetical protein n=1 Tax=Bacillus cereus group TaxID=86661 RepID=UPI000772918C|nr:MULTISPECIES: hypothetical protein [Bacillus cereus group]KXI37997.1 hypothetical protein ACS53_19550 [Bacillus cereus]MCC2457984.1 hypothetical protein [Bacillus cereus]MCC2478487.1 hypothetical protein [Bacillus paranthracis]MCU5017623.1 hypothetical protein [Bacillus paranthracis]MCU5450275.1 hypothetical protein [Bacillus cereus]